MAILPAICVRYSSTRVSSPVAESMINPLIRTFFGISGCSFRLRTVSCTEDSTDSKPPSQRSKSMPLWLHDIDVLLVNTALYQLL